LPFAAVQHLAQVLHGVPHVFKAVYSGVKPKRRMSGGRRLPASPARKSPITPRAISACTMA
jgi:hypothetical protein